MLFSIITPTFNSANTLERTYESLIKQTYKNFEWILVDDFSNDHGKTRELILELASKAPFNVKCIFLEQNFFCARSVYEATRVASGEYACILDHDDQLCERALEIVYSYIEKFILQSQIDNIAGVVGRCVNEEYKLIGKKFYNDVDVLSEMDIRFKQRVIEELIQFTRIDLLNKYFSSMKPGFTNGYVWSLIAKDYKYVFVNDILRVYDTSVLTSYSNTKSSLVRFPEEKAEALLSALDCYNDYLFYNPFYALQISASAIRHLYNAGKLSKVIFSGRKFSSKFFLFFGMPLGILRAKNVI